MSVLSGLFEKCDLDEATRQFSPARRSFRIHGHSTTIRLESAYWDVLEELATSEGLSLAELIARVQDHCPQLDTRNLASCLRVICLQVSKGGPLDT